MSESVAPALLDTDILSAIMRQNSTALTRARTYLALYHSFSFSIITRYEILRGLHAKRASAQLAAFEQLCNVSAILPLTDSIVARAAMIYADLRRRGMLIGDADILIASTALENGLVVVTNNNNHFQRIDELTLENWLV